jgi:hypothetical protein
MEKCCECLTGTLKILGLGGFGDLIEVECQNPKCGEVYEVEPDGLGQGGLEFVDAQMIEMKKEDSEFSDIGF